MAAEPGEHPQLTPLRLFRSAVLKTFAGQVGFSALSLLGSLITARLLGPAGRGELSVLILVPTLFMIALELGQEFSISHLAAQSGQDRRSLLANGLLYSLALVLPGSALVAATLILVRTTSGSLLLPAIVGGAAVGAGVFVRMGCGMALGTEKVGFYNVSRLVLSGSFPLGVVLLALAGIKEPRPFYYAWCAGTVLVAVLFLVRFSPLGSSPSSGVAAEQLRVGMPIHVANLANFLLLRVDQLLLAALASTAAVGLYSVAVNLVEALWYLPMAAGLVSIPFLSSPSHSEAEKRQALLHALRMSVGLPLVGAVVLGTVSPVLVPLVFGDRFDGAVVPLLLLLPGIICAGSSRVCSAALIARKKTKVIWRASLSALAVNLVLNVVLIPIWEARGAAIASSLSYGLLGYLLVKATSREWSLR
jgi:O-antigen/teichoic acid export membrane protein